MANIVFVYESVNKIINLLLVWTNLLPVLPFIKSMGKNNPVHTFFLNGIYDQT